MNVDTGARMADRAPRVWLEGDEVPAGVPFVGFAGRPMAACDGSFRATVPLVELLVPDFAAAVAAEQERRAAQIAGEPSGDPPPPNPAPEPSESHSDDLGRSHDPGAWQLPGGVQVHTVAAASLSPQLAQNAPEVPR